MARRIAVVGPGPAWRKGVAAVLAEAGFATVEIETIAAWKPGRGGSAIAIRAANDEALSAIATFASEHPHIPLVAVMPEIGPGEYATAVRAGAAGAVAEDDRAEVFAVAFAAAFVGRAAVPLNLMRAIASRVPRAAVDSWLSDVDAERLRRLASGVTVAEMADRAGYSEREMFRMLNDLYDTIGVANRTQAIIWATRHGILDDAADG